MTHTYKITGRKGGDTMIKSTKQYDKFKLIEGNRNLVPGHLARLTVSILQKNLLAQNPIIVNERFEVIDGQHRLEIAKSNDLEIFYLVVPGASIEEVVVLNANNRSWNGTDFLNSYASRGRKDYIWLRRFMDDYSISLTQALAFLYGHDSSWSSRSIRSGKLAINEAQKENAVQRADVLYDIRPYIKRSGFIPRAFLLELIHFVDKGHGKELAQALQKRGEHFIPESSRKEAYKQLRELTYFKGNGRKATTVRVVAHA